jgi:predicted Zn-dependent peptidase
MKPFPKVLQALCLMLAMLYAMAAGQERASTSGLDRLKAQLRTSPDRLKAELRSADTAPQGIESLRDRVKEHVLANGMRFLLLERHTSPTVAVHVYFDVGSVDEQVGQTGIAHLYEHMAFKGTREIGTTNYGEESKHFAEIDRIQAELARERDKGAAADKAAIQKLEADLKKATDEAEKYVVPNEVGRILEENGAARLNAQTERDQTHYYLSLPSNKIELWMAIESDRIQNPVLRELYTERDVVMEELRRTIDTNPINKLLLEDVITTAFHAHPYGLHSGIGWPSDVAHITRAEVERFFKKYYGAANCTIAIVGDFDTAKIIPMLDRYFSSAQSGEKNPGVVTIEPTQDGERRIELESPIQPILALGYHRPNTMSDDDVIYDIIEHLLTDGRTSRLYKNLVEGKAIAAEVAALPNPPLVTAKYPSLFEIIGVPVTPAHTVAELEQAIDQELEKLKSQPVDKQELQKIINQVDYGFVRSLTSNETLAELLAFTQGLEGDWKRLLVYRQKLAAVTPADVMRVCRQTFTKSNRTVAYIVPKLAPKGAASGVPTPGLDKKQED